MEKLAGSTDFDHMAKSRAQHLFEEEQQIMESGIPVINREWFVPVEMTGDGTTHWFLVTKVPVYDEKGTCVGLVGINRNITEHKLASQRAIELQLSQRRSHLLAGFVRDTSHEFRTPISVIQTASYLLHKATDDAKRDIYAGRIDEQIERLTRLINMLITMSKLDQMESIQLEPISVKTLIESLLVNLTANVDRHGLRLQQTISPSLQTIYGDAELLMMALSAMIENAIRYTASRWFDKRFISVQRHNRR